MTTLNPKSYYCFTTNPDAEVEMQLVERSGIVEPQLGLHVSSQRTTTTTGYIVSAN